MDEMPGKTPDQWFEEYGESHQNHANKLVHWICVPAITVSLLGLLWSIPTPGFAGKQISRGISEQQLASFVRMVDCR